MSDDIVARLRIAWTSCTDKVNSERAEAADEIERLRGHYAEAEKDHCDYVAKYCKATEEIERLRDLMEGYDFTFMGQRAEIKRLRQLLGDSEELRKEAKP